MVTPKQSGRVAVVVAYADPATGDLWRKEVLAPAGQNIGWAVNASGIAGVFASWRETGVLTVAGRRAKADAPLADGMVIYVGVKADREMMLRFRDALKDLRG